MADRVEEQSIMREASRDRSNDRKDLPSSVKTVEEVRRYNPQKSYNESIGAWITSDQQGYIDDTTSSWLEKAGTYKEEYDKLKPHTDQLYSQWQNFETGSEGSFKSDYYDKILESKNGRGMPNYMRIKVVGGPNNEVQGTYIVERQVANNLANNGSYWTNFDGNGNLYVDVKAKNGQVIGKELHSQLGPTQQRTLESINAAAALSSKNQYNQNVSDKNALGAIYNKQADITDSWKAAWSTEKAKPSQFLNALKQQYADRAENIKKAMQGGA